MKKAKTILFNVLTVTFAAVMIYGGYQIWKMNPKASSMDKTS